MLWDQMKLSRIVRFARRRSRMLAETAAQRYYEWRSPELVIVFTLPKVGSSTVWHSLRAAHLSAPIYHVHLLSSNADRLFDEAVAEGKHIPDPDEQLREIRRIRELVAAGKHAKVVTLVREPVGRYLSWFFQGWRDNFPALSEAATHEIDPRKLAEAQDALLARREIFCNASKRWFDAELREVFGYDVLASEFPRAQGYEVYRRDHSTLLLLRLEDLNRCHRDAFRDFMGLENFQLVQTNVASEKRYRRFYDEFQRYVTLPPSLLDELYTLPYVRHFYSEAEIARFRAKWLRRSSHV